MLSSTRRPMGYTSPFWATALCSHLRHPLPFLPLANHSTKHSLFHLLYPSLPSLPESQLATRSKDFGHPFALLHSYPQPLSGNTITCSLSLPLRRTSTIMAAYIIITRPTIRDAIFFIFHGSRTSLSFLFVLGRAFSLVDRRTLRDYTPTYHLLSTTPRCLLRCNIIVPSSTKSLGWYASVTQRESCLSTPRFLLI